MDNSSFTDNKPSKAKIVWIVLLTIILIASNTAWGLFYFQQQGNTNAKISKLSVENSVLGEELADAKAADKNSNSGWRDIPELGVRYKVTDVTKDLTYLYENNYVSFSTKALSDSSYKGKNPSGNTIDAYFCGLSGNGMGGGFSSGTLSLSSDYEENPEKQKPSIVKKLSSKKTAIFYTDSPGNGSGTTDEKNAITPIPAEGCDKTLRENAIKAAEEAVNSLRSID